MNPDPCPPVPDDVASMSIDLNALCRRSVATLYSHLVTRPTGRALRVGIESQLQELGGPALSVLDFHQVVVLDYSCADETVAKLLRRFQAEDRPADIYFIASGIAERHREPIEEVLLRHGLALVAELEEGDVALLGDVPDTQRAVWATLQRTGRCLTNDVATALALPCGQAEEALEALVSRRLAFRVGTSAYSALTAAISPRA